MILVDTALAQREKEKKPIRVGMVGAGFMAGGVALQILKYTKGMRLVAIANRTVSKARDAYGQVGITDVDEVSSMKELDKTITSNTYAVTDDPLILCQSKHIDVIVEITGSIEHACRVVMEAIQHKKHIVSMNAELDGTLGPILKTYADRAGVIYTNVEGDQPGLELNLYRYVKGLGLRPVLCGNVKGLHDPYRTPKTQEGFAKQWGQKPEMVTSFADGTKISFEQAIVANGIGMHVAQQGMLHPTVPVGTSISEAVNLFPLDELKKGKGIVDYVIGAKEPGVFVLATTDDPRQQHFLRLYKMGDGPLYCFYNPYHICHFEVPITIARAVLFNDAALTPLDKPYVEVVTVAKRNLKKGEAIDGIGHYMTYGVCENHDTARKQNMLPIGLAEGCVLKRDIAKDDVVSFDDVTLPPGRLSDKLWKEQLATFD